MDTSRPRAGRRREPAGCRRRRASLARHARMLGLEAWNRQSSARSHPDRDAAVGVVGLSSVGVAWRETAPPARSRPAESHEDSSRHLPLSLAGSSWRPDARPAVSRGSARGPRSLSSDARGGRGGRLRGSLREFGSRPTIRAPPVSVRCARPSPAARCSPGSSPVPTSSARSSQLSREVDVVVLQLVRLARLLERLEAPVYVDLIDALSLNFEARSRLDRPWLRPILMEEARRLRQQEALVIDTAAGCCVVCERDREALEQHAGSSPDVVHLPMQSHEPQQERSERPTVALTGNLGTSSTPTPRPGGREPCGLGCTKPCPRCVSCSPATALPRAFAVKRRGLESSSPPPRRDSSTSSNRRTCRLHRCAAALACRSRSSRPGPARRRWSRRPTRQPESAAATERTSWCARPRKNGSRRSAVASRRPAWPRDSRARPQPRLEVEYSESEVANQIRDRIAEIARSA